MNHRSSYIRRSRKGQRLQKRIAAAAMLGVVACAALLLQERVPDLRSALPAATAPAAQTAAAGGLRIDDAVDNRGTRRVYPYSVVAGGVGNRAELERIVRTDKVVAAHYASFEVDKAHAVAVTKARAVHVSYRKGDKVYWTAKKVMLAEGETVLSDGRSEIRGRCGNRISDVAQLPVEAAAPSEEELDSSVEAAPDGPVNVAYAVDGAGGGQHAFELLSFANGAGMLATSGGEGWRAPSAQAVRAFDADPARYNGMPTMLASASGSGSGTGTVGTGGTVGDAASGADADAGSGAAGGSVTGGGSTSETPHTDGNPLAAQPAAGAGVPAAVDQLTGALPLQSADAIQPGAGIQTPALPDVLLWPKDLPTVPVKPVQSSAEAPEPATLWLGGAGLAAMLLAARRRRRG